MLERCSPGGERSIENNRERYPVGIADTVMLWGGGLPLFLLGGGILTLMVVIGVITATLTVAGIFLGRKIDTI